jgi:hypothetical protein
LPSLLAEEGPAAPSSPPASFDAPLVPPLVKLLGHRQRLRELAPGHQPPLRLELLRLVPVVLGVLKRMVRDPEHGARGHKEPPVRQGEVAVGDADLARADRGVHAKGLCECVFVFVWRVGELEREREKERSEF